MNKRKLKWNYIEFTFFQNVENTSIKDKYKNLILGNIRNGIFIPKLFLKIMPIVFVIYMINVHLNIYVDLPSFVPEKYHYQFIPYLFRVTLTLYSCGSLFFVLAFDTIVICHFVHLEAQFDLLAYQFKRIIDDLEANKKDEIIKCIKYHRFLLRFSQRTKEIFFVFCLIYFVMVLFIIGSQMFILAL